jgi:hypothetical protein
VGNWPNDSFAWVKSLMRESVARTAVSPEILAYHSYVLGGVQMLGEDELTRNLDVVENIILFLNENIEPASWVLELRAGTGICTTPLAQYYAVVAIDNNKQYCSLFERYLEDQSKSGAGTVQRVVVIPADIRDRHNLVARVNTEAARVNGHAFAAVVLNPPFDTADIIRQSFEVAMTLTPTPEILVAVLPLDVIEEAGFSYSWRIAEQPRLVEQDRRFISALRVDWKLIAVEPTIRSDGSAQVGTFLFKKSAN